MTIKEFIAQEYNSLIKGEAKNYFKGDILNVLLEKLDTIQIFPLDAFIEELKLDKQISQLKYSNILINMLYELEEVKKECPNSNLECRDWLNDILGRINKKIKENPSDKIYPILWLDANIALIRFDEVFESDIINVLNVLIEKYNYIFDLENWAYDSEIFRHFPSRIFFSENIMSIIQELSNKYPGEMLLKELIIIYYSRKQDFKKTLFLIESYLGLLSAEEKEFNYTDMSKRSSHLTVLQEQATAYFEMKEYELSLHSLNQVLDNLTLFGYPYNNEYDMRGFEACLLMRVSINLKKNDKEKLQHDFDFLRKSVAWNLDILAEQEVFKAAAKHLDLDSYNDIVA